MGWAGGEQARSGFWGLGEEEGDMPAYNAARPRRSRSTCRKSARDAVDFTRFAPIEVETVPGRLAEADLVASTAPPSLVYKYTHPRECNVGLDAAAPSPSCLPRMGTSCPLVGGQMRGFLDKEGKCPPQGSASTPAVGSLSLRGKEHWKLRTWAEGACHSAQGTTRPSHVLVGMYKYLEEVFPRHGEH